MKIICIILIVLSLYADCCAGMRNIIMLLDWDQETVGYDLNKLQFNVNDQGFGPPSYSIITHLGEKAAPMLISSSNWRNVVERRKMFGDFLAGKGKQYLNKFTRFSNEKIIKEFEVWMQSYYNRAGKNILKNSKDPLFMETFSYFLCHAALFEKAAWIIKKVSDYLYLFIPKQYLEKVQQEKLADQPRSFVKNLSQDELSLGLKINSMQSMSYEDALNPNKHKQAIALEQQLMRPADFKNLDNIIQQGGTVQEKVIFSKHVLKVLPELFVTRADLKAQDDLQQDVTRAQEALYLHDWFLYMNGHGSPTSVIPVGEQYHTQAYRSLFIDFAFLAGLDLAAFRDLLFFLNWKVNTLFLMYETCFSGGHHLLKVFEHHWTFPDWAENLKKQKSKVTPVPENRVKFEKPGMKLVAQADIFNYMIVAGNLAHTETWTDSPSFSIPFSKAEPIVRNYSMLFNDFFASAHKYFRVSKSSIQQKKRYFQVLQEIDIWKKKFLTAVGEQQRNEVINKIVDLKQELQTMSYITLNGVIQFVHNLDTKHQYFTHPAVRYANTEWFVPLALPQKAQQQARIRFEEGSEMERLKDEQKKSKELFEQWSKKYVEKIAPTNTQQDFLKKAIQNLTNCLRQLQKFLH